MTEERTLLCKKIIPELQAELQTKGIYLTVVDLRWGITVYSYISALFNLTLQSEQSAQGNTLRICLSEGFISLLCVFSMCKVDRCRPWFVGFIGERYGWHQNPGTAGNNQMFYK